MTLRAAHMALALLVFFPWALMLLGGLLIRT